MLAISKASKWFSNLNEVLIDRMQSVNGKFIYDALLNDDPEHL